MPIFDVQAPNGKIYSVEAPEGTAEDQIFAFVNQQMGAEPKPKEGIGASFMGGVKRYGSDLETALESIINPKLAAERGVERTQKIGEQYAPGASLDKVIQAYKERGIFPAAGEAISQIPSALAEQFPNTAAALGGARLGAMAGSAIAPGVGTVIGGVAGAGLASLPQLYAQNIQRQAEEKAPEISRAGALGAAVPGAALEVASQFIPLGRGLLGKLLGPQAEEFLKRGANEAVEKAAKESILGSVTRGGITGLATEIPTEVAQQMLERLQAGLPLTTNDALKEYGEAAYGAGLVGGPFGAGARTLGRSGAQAEYKQQVERQQQEELAAEQQLQAEQEARKALEPETYEFPGGYKATAVEVGRSEVPEGYQIYAEGSETPLTQVEKEEDVQPKLERLNNIRKSEAEKALEQIDKISEDINKARTTVETLEATGQTQTEQYMQAQETLRVKEEQGTTQTQELMDKVQALSAPLTSVAMPLKTKIQNEYVLTKGDEVLGRFPTPGQAEAKAAEQVGPEEYQKQYEAQQGRESLKAQLEPMLKKFGLRDVGLNIADQLENGAGGKYVNKLISVAMDEPDPVRVMKHESIHALKDLGFFTPEQIKVLNDRASKEWINKYLGLQQTEIDGKPMSRLEGYRLMAEKRGLTPEQTEQEIIEEAIADAFGDFDAGAKPPPGMIASLFKRIKAFFEALRNSFRGAGFQTADDIFKQIESGKLKPVKAAEVAKQEKPEEEKLSLPKTVNRQTPSEKNAWKATPTEEEQAIAYEEANGILPYVSEGPVKVSTEKYSIQKFNPEKHLEFNPALGVPINKDGTVTLYYHTTKEKAVKIGNQKVVPSEGRNRVYLTNESVGADILRNRGNFEQDLDGSTVLIYANPELLQLDKEYDNGRRDFFIPITQGDYFNKKMKLQSIQKGRGEAIVEEFSYGDHEGRITSAVTAYQQATPAERKKMVAAARKFLKKEHNVSSLLSENGKLEKTRVGDYNLTYDGNSVASLGLGLASAQQISEKVSTCPRSAICEGLCLGETSGGNFMFGGAAQEDVGDIKKSSFRAAARMMQYLKTEALIVHPEEFTTLLQGEIDSFSKWANSPTERKRDPVTKAFLNIEKEIYAPAIRLNVTSDFKPDMFKGLMAANPDVTFYDYTKLGSDPIAPNHHLTFSSTGFGQIIKGEKVFFKDKAGRYDHNWATMRDRRLNKGQNVAMAFSSKSALPKFLQDEETGATYRVLDGDDYDARFLDESSQTKQESNGLGVIVGLRNKAGNLSEKNAVEKTGGFFVQYDPKTDGDTIVVPNQAEFKQKVIPIAKGKLSLRAAPNTPEFKRWFGNSKVVNKNGDPLVVYHGTYNDISEFKLGEKANRTGNPDGFYFTPDAQEASGYADRGDGADDGNVMPVYLKIENPFLRGSNVDNRMLGQFEKELRAENPNLNEDWISGKMEIFKDKAARNNFPGIFPNITFTPAAMTRVLQAGGYDGFKDGSHWIAIKPEQIKSATGNVGTYDIKNPDIRYSLKTSFPTAAAAVEATKDITAPDTKEFKLFQGASTLKEDGKPKLMFHGSKNIFFTFRDNDPIFVAEDADSAEYFARDKGMRTKASAVPNQIYPLWVRAETPFDFENPVHVDSVVQLVGDDKILEKMREGDWRTIEGAPVQKALKQLGFDSFYVNELRDDTGQVKKNLAVFKANQVKSATGNFGDFSEKRDIRYSLPNISASANAAVGRVTTTRETKGWADRLVGALAQENYSSYRQQALNRYNRLGEADKLRAEKMGGAALLASNSAESAALMSDLHSGVVASVMGVGDRRGGIPILRNGITTVDHSQKGVTAIFAPLAQYQDPKVYQYFQFYSAVKRGARLLQEGRERVITPQDVKHAQELGQKFPEFEGIRKEWVSFNNALVKYQVETGVLSKKDADVYTMYSDYIPFYRQMDGEKTIGPNIFQSISGVKKPKALKGGEAPLADFLETVVRNTHAAIGAGMKNVAAQRAVSVGKDVGIVHDVQPGHAVSALEQIVVLENGVKTVYQANDQLFVDAVKSLNMPELPFMSILSAPANLLRNLVTKDPGFIMTNLLRDSLSAYITSGTNATPIAGTVINFAKGMKGNSPSFEALMDAGIIGGYEFSANVEQSGATLAKDLARKSGKGGGILTPFTSLWEGLEKASTASDAATRMAVYDRVLQETGNEAEALYRALEVMNFNRKGSSAVVRILTAAVPFLNARMQGLDIFYRASFGRMNTADAKEIQRKFFVRGMTMLGLSALYYFAVAGSPDYEKQEQETKDNNWLIPGVGIKIPIPFEVGTLFKTVPERIAAYLFGTDTGEDFKKAMWRAANGFIPMSPAAYIPQTLKPLLEVMTNYSFFTQREIVNSGLKDVDPEFQVGPGTSAMSQFVGKTLGLSPMKVDHMLKGYTGTMGMYAIDMMDSVMDQFGDSPKPSKRFEQMPVIKRFALDPEARGSVTNYYELKDSVDTAVRTMNLLERSAKPKEFAEYLQKNVGVLAVKDYVADLEKSMKDLRDMKRTIQGSPMKSDEKRDAITAIGQAESNLTQNIQTVKRAISELK